MPRQCRGWPTTCRRACARRRHPVDRLRTPRCSAIRAAFSSADAGIPLLDLRGQPAVQCGAVGFQLRLVGDGTDQRMAKHILRARRELDLVDELRLHELREARLQTPRGLSVALASNSELIEPPRRGAWRLGERRRAGRAGRRWSVLQGRRSSAASSSVPEGTEERPPAAPCSRLLTGRPRTTPVRKNEPSPAACCGDLSSSTRPALGRGRRRVPATKSCVSESFSWVSGIVSCAGRRAEVARWYPALEVRSTSEGVRGRTDRNPVSNEII